MSQRVLMKVKTGKASEVCADFDLDAIIRKHLENEPSQENSSTF